MQIYKNRIKLKKQLPKNNHFEEICSNDDLYDDSTERRLTLAEVEHRMAYMVGPPKLAAASDSTYFM